MAGEPRASTRIERKPGPLLAGFSIAYVLFVAGFALYVAIRSHDDRLTEFFLDDWLNLFLREELPFFQWLFAYHNAHLIPATRLLLHLDYEYLSGRGVLPWLASFLSTGVTIAVLYRVLGMSRLDDLPSRRTLGAFFGFCLLWTGLFYGYLWGFSVHAPMTTMWLVVSVSCFVAIAVRPNGERAEIGRRLAVFGVAAALMATLSSAAGLCAWVALLVIAVAARLSRGITIAVVLGGAVSAALLAHAPVPAGSTADVVGRWLSEPATLLAFILSFIGIPVGWTAQGLFTLGDPAMRTVCLWAGGLGVVGLLAHSVRSLRATPVSDPLCLLGLALMGYCTAAATLAGLGGRTHFGAVN